jgi:hypothetical protein
MKRAQEKWEMKIKQNTGYQYYKQLNMVRSDIYGFESDYTSSLGKHNHCQTIKQRVSFTWCLIVTTVRPIQTLFHLLFTPIKSGGYELHFC